MSFPPGAFGLPQSKSISERSGKRERISSCSRRAHLYYNSSVLNQNTRSSIGAKGQKVLLIRFSALGDLVLLTSTLEILSRLETQVTLVTKDEFRELFQDDPRTRLILLKKNESLWELLKEVRKEKYDYAFDLQKKLVSYLLLKGVRAGKKFSYRKRALRRRMAVWFKRPIREVPVVQLYAEPIFKALRTEFPLPPPRIFVREDKSLNPSEDYAVLGIGSRHRTKIWPFFGDLAVQIKERYEIRPVLVGDLGDVSLGEELKEGLSVNLLGKTSIRSLVAILRGARFVVSNDSGVAHISASLGTPTVVFFGPTVPSFGFRPIGERVIVLEYEGFLSCRPCSLHGEKECKRKDKICLAGIPAGKVIEAIECIIK